MARVLFLLPHPRLPLQAEELGRAHNGKREKVAAALGVSKTTLWRHMKKHGIGSDFSNCVIIS